MFIPGEDEVDDLNASLLHGLLKVHIIEAKVSQKGASEHMFKGREDQ